MNIISNGYGFRRGTGSPFDALPNPDIDLGNQPRSKGIACQWCRHCSMSVDTRCESYNQNQVWGQKHWCKRCGNVTASAIYFNVGIQVVDPPALLTQAKRWMNESESKG